MKKFFQALSFLGLFVFSTYVVAEPVNINTANATEISKKLKGVGLKKAQAIIKFRNKYGAFKTVDALAKVKGIGFKTVEKNRANISVAIIKGK